MSQTFIVIGAILIVIAIGSCLVIMGAVEESPLQKLAVWVAVATGMWGFVLLLSGLLVRGASLI